MLHEFVGLIQVLAPTHTVAQVDLEFSQAIRPIGIELDAHSFDASADADRWPDNSVLAIA